MYTPKIFQNENTEEVLQFIKQNSFGILLNQSKGRVIGSHIPLYLDKNKAGNVVLHGHISLANTQWKAFNDTEEVLVIFNGPHAYVSSSWYDHANVPTWNYIAVHVYGKLKILEGRELYDSLSKLVDKYEANSEKPVSMASMDEEMLAQNLKGIVGFEIEITEIQPTYKLSQNRDAKNHESIVSALENTKQAESIALANAMKTQRNHESH